MKNFRKIAFCFAMFELAVLFVGCGNSSDVPLFAFVNFGNSSTSEKTITFGAFPQSLKKESVTVDENEKKKVGLYTYYRGSDGEWYVKLYPSYYKVEPIKWTVLTTNYNGKKLLLAKNVLLTCKYYDYLGGNRNMSGNTVYPNNYKYSRIRAYLNGYSYYEKSGSSAQVNNISFENKGFLQTAFTSDERAKIVTVRLDNSERSTNPDENASQWNGGSNKYACEDTSDKVFLLSSQEITKAEYGFFTSEARNVDGNTRIRKPTAYAAAYEPYMNPDDGEYVWWWLRSPAYNGKNDCSVRAVGSNGYAAGSVSVNGSDGVHNYTGGVVPALCLEN